MEKTKWSLRVSALMLVAMYSCFSMVYGQSGSRNSAFGMSNTQGALSFNDFLMRVNAAPVSLRTAIIDSFMTVVPSFPFIENDTTVHFIYRGTASSVTIPGDANNWNTYAFPMTNVSGTDFWYYTCNFESDARLEYKFFINGSSWIFDPRNRDQFNYVNSELKMPKYPDAPELEYYPGISHGAMHDTLFNSSILGNSRTIQIYTPPGYKNSSDSFAVVLFQDGDGWTTVGKANNVIDYLIFKDLIMPVIAVFVPPVNRDAEYWSSQQSQFASFICNELMPYIDANYRTCRNAESRAVIGSSAGSVISLYLGYHYPNVFGNVGAMSGANQENMDSYKNGSIQHLKIYTEVGTYEVPYYADVTNFRAILQTRGYDYHYDECHEGHSWGNWRTHLDDALKFFFGDQPSSIGVQPSNPQYYALRQNYPNPFNPTTNFEFHIAKGGLVTLRVYNVLGEEVASIVNKELPTGDYKYQWNACNLASGVYFYRITAGKYTATKKLILLR